MSKMLAWVKYTNSLGGFINGKGRASRAEFWWNYLFYLIAITVISICTSLLTWLVSAIGVDLITAIVGGLCAIIMFVVEIVYCLKMVPLMIRRFHDNGYSGWILLLTYLLMACCGIGVIIWLIILIKDSDPNPNAYGPSPKSGGGGYGGYGGYNNYNGGYGQANGGYTQNNGTYNPGNGWYNPGNGGYNQQ